MRGLVTLGLLFWSVSGFSQSQANYCASIKNVKCEVLNTEFKPFNYSVQVQRSGPSGAGKSKEMTNYLVFKKMCINGQFVSAVKPFSLPSDLEMNSNEMKEVNQYLNNCDYEKKQ